MCRSILLRLLLWFIIRDLSPALRTSLGFQDGLRVLSSSVVDEILRRFVGIFRVLWSSSVVGSLRRLLSGISSIVGDGRRLTSEVPSVVSDGRRPTSEVSGVVGDGRRLTS
jgi:hypothetical protein